MSRDTTQLWKVGDVLRYGPHTFVVVELMSTWYRCIGLKGREWEGFGQGSIVDKRAEFVRNMPHEMVDLLYGRSSIHSGRNSSRKKS